MKNIITCPVCNATCIDVRNYESMMVLREDIALFTVKCPSCGALVSTVKAIPSQLRDEVQFAALELGAGMGREN